MRRAAFDSSLNLVVSVIIIGFIVVTGFYEINFFIQNRSMQLFQDDLNTIADDIDYLVESNSLGSFLQASINLPANQSLIFDNESNLITAAGAINKIINPDVDILDYLNLSSEGVYDLTVCYECGAEREYLVGIR